jgi:hypothetical protein
MSIATPAIEDVGAETIAPVRLATISLITEQIIGYVTFVVVDEFEPLLLLLFPF